MPAKLRFFFLGSFGLVVLALAWMIFRSETTRDSEETSGATLTMSATPSFSPKTAVTPQENPSTSKTAPITAPSVASAPDSHDKDAIIAEHTFTEPSGIVFLDQSPEQKTIQNYIDLVGSMKFPAVEEPLFVGVNDQGFDQYEYKARDGSYVKQWKRSGEISVEEVTLDNGDKIIRRAPEQESPLTTVSFESKNEKTYKSVSYRSDGTVSSIYVESGGGGTTYYYDQQGRLTGTRTWAPPTDKK